MSICVRVAEPPLIMGYTPSNEAVTNQSVALLIPDPRCTSGLRIYTQEEITTLVSSAPPGSGSGSSSTAPDATLMRETFFMSFGLVIGIWFVGKCVGAVLRLIKGEESEFS